MTCDDVRDLAAGFVLDALTPDEMAAVREHLATCAEAHEEIAELAAALPVLAADVPVVAPPAALGARIRAAAEADLAARSMSEVDRPAPTPAPAPAPATATPQPATVTTFPSTAERDARTARPSTSPASWLLRIAAVLAIVVLGGSTLVLRGQLQSAEAYQQSVAAVLDVAGQPGSLTAVLTAEGGGPSGLAAVSASGEMTLAMQALPATTGTQVYEAWVIAADGQPVPLGSVAVGSTGTASLASTGVPTEPGMVLALTLEPASGATTPTLPIVAAGPATASTDAG